MDDAKASGWQDSLKDFVKTNPDVEGSYTTYILPRYLIHDPFIGFPAEDKQFFEL